MARLLIGAGGTGGHIYPALAVVEALRKGGQPHTITFVGSTDGFERPLIEQSGVQLDHYAEVSAGPLNGVGPLRAARSLGQIALGVAQSVRLMRRQRPQAILLTGGWPNVPVALAAWALRVPMLVYLPDIEPGKTIEYLAKLGPRVAVTVEASQRYFRDGQTVVTGYPLRQQMLTATREAGQAHFKLDPTRRTLLVFGGSRGARSINQALEAILPTLLAEGVQVIHVTGTLDWERSQAATEPHPHYHAYPYLHTEMALALAAADVALCRAGASTLGELPHFGLPAVLVPYPHAWRYQRTNADWLAERGAALRLNDEDMAEQLLPTLRRLLQDTVQWEAMRTAARSIAREGAAALVQELIRMTGDET
ncbi:MAG: UDP-N-acetylglucosamine--N-acetylmuramyl-(pentapeptide) pyrophosphoryl-undecaprenol N-acetylglucosamine transferase [Anaerolineae bacterium]